MTRPAHRGAVAAGDAVSGKDHAAARLLLDRVAAQTGWHLTWTWAEETVEALQNVGKPRCKTCGEPVDSSHYCPPLPSPPEAP